jgi:hypothetical protein
VSGDLVNRVLTGRAGEVRRGLDSEGPALESVPEYLDRRPAPVAPHYYS